MKTELWHSEACRQEAIGRQADRISQDITSCLLTDDGEAQEIGGDMLAFMDETVMARLIRFALRGDLTNLRQLLAQELDKSIRRVADHRAIRLMEDMIPEG